MPVDGIGTVFAGHRLHGHVYDSAVGRWWRNGDIAGWRMYRYDGGHRSRWHIGDPFALPQLGSSFVLEPQAQIVWQHTAFDQRNDGEGEVGLGSADMTSGRLGVRGKWTLVTDDHQVWEPYVRVNFWDDWNAHSSTNFSGTNVILLASGERLEVGGGVSVLIKDSLSFYINADYEFAVGHNDGGKRDGVRGAAGLRYSW